MHIIRKLEVSFVSKISVLTVTEVTKTQRNTGALVNSFCSLLHFAVQLGHFDLAL